MEFIIILVVGFTAYFAGKATTTQTDEEMLRQLIRKQLDGRLLEMSQHILAQELLRTNAKLVERKKRNETAKSS